MTLRSRLNRQFQARHTPVHCAFLCRESSDSYSSAKPGSLLTLASQILGPDVVSPTP